MKNNKELSLLNGSVDKLQRTIYYGIKLKYVRIVGAFFLLSLITLAFWSIYK